MPDALRPIRILVVEDDPPTAAALVQTLRRAGYEPELAASGAIGCEKGLQGGYDLAVLDLGLPDLGGFEVLEAWRGRTSIPTIVLTANTALAARTGSFERGAIDWVAKPFFAEELLARIRARLASKPPDERALLAWADVVLDPQARTVRRAGAPIALTPSEFNLLLHLVERAGRSITRRQLAHVALTHDTDPSERTVDSHIARVRRKLGEAAGAAIATVWGVGYRFDAEVP